MSFPATYTVLHCVLGVLLFCTLKLCAEFSNCFYLPGRNSLMRTLRTQRDIAFTLNKYVETQRERNFDVQKSFYYPFLSALPASRVISEGENVPLTVSWPIRLKNEFSEDYSWGMLAAIDIFSEKRVIVFGLPGAFTPTCSNLHLPAYERLYEELKKQSIDEVYCLSVNDYFVMNAWKKQLNVEKVKIIPDGNGSFSQAIGLLVNKANIGFGKRVWRFSMVVKKGMVEKLFVEPGLTENSAEDPFGKSSAENMLKYLKHVNI